MDSWQILLQLCRLVQAREWCGVPSSGRRHLEHLKRYMNLDNKFPRRDVSSAEAVLIFRLEHHLRHVTTSEHGQSFTGQTVNGADGSP